MAVVTNRKTDRGGEGGVSGGSGGGVTAPAPAPAPPSTSTPNPTTAAPADAKREKEKNCKTPEENLLLDIVNRCALHDGSGYFSDPVTEEVAPGYFDVIKKPMDFFTIRKKIEERVYRTWRQFVEDLELICSNAMTYNQKRSKVHKAAGHLQRCLRKVLRETELEGRRAILMRHPSACESQTSISRNVFTDTAVPNAVPEISAEAWKDEQQAAAEVAARNNLAIEEVEKKCLAAYVRSACAMEALRAPLTKEEVQDADAAEKKLRKQKRMRTMGNEEMRKKEEHLARDWSSFSDTDDEVSGGEERKRREKRFAQSKVMHSGATTSQEDEGNDISRPAIVQVEHFEALESKADGAKEGQAGGEKNAIKNDEGWKKWREDSSRNEIGWRCRWIERRIRLLECEERRYEKRLQSMKAHDRSEKTIAQNQNATNGVDGEEAKPCMDVRSSDKDKHTCTSTRCSPIARARPAKIKRRKLNKKRRDFKTEESFAGWLGVFSHLGAADKFCSAQKREGGNGPQLLHEDVDSDSDKSENLLVDVMEEALLMHKQIHCLHAQIAYARQHINRQGKIVHRSAVPPIIDTQIFKTRIGAQLLALEHERNLNQHAANGDERPLNSPGGSGYFTHGSSFDMDNVVSPMGASKIPPPLKVEFINTPRVREIEMTPLDTKDGPEAKDSGKVKVEGGEKAGGEGTKPAEEDSSGDETEDTSDEAYERLHKPLEVAERNRFVAPVPGLGNKNPQNPLDVQHQTPVSAQMNPTEVRSRRPAVRNM